MSPTTDLDAVPPWSYPEGWGHFEDRALLSCYGRAPQTASSPRIPGLKSDPLCPTPKPWTGFLPKQGLRMTAGLLISCQMFPHWAPKQQSVSSSHSDLSKILSDVTMSSLTSALMRWIQTITFRERQVLLSNVRGGQRGRVGQGWHGVGEGAEGPVDWSCYRRQQVHMPRGLERQERLIADNKRGEPCMEPLFQLGSCSVKLPQGHELSCWESGLAFMVFLSLKNTA